MHCYLGLKLCEFSYQPETGLGNSFGAHVRFRGTWNMTVFYRARLECTGWFPVAAGSERGYGHGLGSAQNAWQDAHCRSFTLHPDNPQHLPSVSQEPSLSEIYLMMVIILCSLFISHNPKHTIWVGSNLILYKTQSLVVFQFLCGFAFCMYQFNFALLLELFGEICKIKSFAALVN